MQILEKQKIVEECDYYKIVEYTDSFYLIKTVNGDEIPISIENYEKLKQCRKSKMLF
jgi:hypothetical protein